MNFLLLALRNMIPDIDLYDPGSTDLPFPYVTYEYNSVTFENQYQILFSMDITSDNAYEVDVLATEIRQKLHEKRYNDENVGFVVTQAPPVQVTPDQREGVHSRRLDFTIIAYFKEEL